LHHIAQVVSDPIEEILGSVVILEPELFEIHREAGLGDAMVLY
jgi:hypothetical protein